MIRRHGLRPFSSPCMAILHEPQPAQPSGSRFTPALHPPEDAPRAAAWFAFNGDRLLVRRDADQVELADYAELAKLGADFEAGHYLGRLDDVDCYALDLETSTEAPPGTSFEGLRGLYGGLSEDNYSIAGRAVQILLWDKTHRDRVII